MRTMHGADSPTRKANVVWVQVTFKVDANDHLSVEGEDLGTGDKYTCQLEEGMVVSGSQPQSAAVAPVAVCA